MQRTQGVAAFLAVAALGGAAYAVYQYGMSRGMRMAAPAAAPAAPGAGAQPADAEGGRRVLYWHDPMVPGPRFDKPGKSPFMDMQLVPVYADEAGGEGGVRIDPGLRQNLGVRTAPVTRGRVESRVEVVGNVAFNERDVAAVQARSTGFVERLHVRAPLDPVRAGQALAELYVPEWVGAQEEFLAARRLQAGGLAGLADAARQRMRLAGMTEEHMARVEREGRVQPRLMIVSPIAGVVSELSVREGMTVSPGAALFRINGLGTVWVLADVPESLAHAVRPGVRAEVRATAFPGQVFKGRVSAILPEVDPATRTLKARIEVANPGMRLVPGMFAQVELPPQATGDTLLIPTEAVIRTGTRDVVMVARGEGFASVEVELGRESGGRTEVRKGLEEGDRVVVSGQFLVDSEASLKGVEARLAPPERDAATKPEAAAKAGPHRGEGKVESVEKGRVTLSHGPMPSLGWPAMTMEFSAAPGVLPPGLAPGESVTFETRAAGEGEWAITRIERKAAAR